MSKTIILQWVINGSLVSLVYDHLPLWSSVSWKLETCFRNLMCSILRIIWLASGESRQICTHAKVVKSKRIWSQRFASREKRCLGVWGIGSNDTNWTSEIGDPDRTKGISFIPDNLDWYESKTKWWMLPHTNEINISIIWQWMFTWHCCYYKMSRQNSKGWRYPTFVVWGNHESWE